MSVIDLRYLRMGVSADLSAANLVLALGQPGYEVDTAQIKIGDGSSAWNALNYFSNGSNSAPTAIPAAIVIPLDTAGEGKIMPSVKLTANSVFTVGAGVVEGGNCKFCLVGNGSNTPNFGAFNNANAYPYNTTDGQQNIYSAVSSYGTTLLFGTAGSVTDTTPATLVSAAVANATPLRIDLTWSEPLNPAISASAAFAVSAGHPLTAHTYVDATHSYLTTSTAFVAGETVTLAYTQPATNKMQDVAGNLTANIAAAAITDGVASRAAVANPNVALIGDSITEFDSFYKPISTNLTRDAAGVVTWTQTSHGFTSGLVGFIGNTTDASYTGEVTYTAVDANTLSAVYAVPVTGLAGTSTPAANCFLSNWAGSTSVGMWQGLQSTFGGALVFNGNYGQGGLYTTQMTDAMNKLLAKTAPVTKIIVLAPGVNDIKADFSAAATWAGYKALIDQALAAASAPNIVALTIEPLGTSFNTTSRRDVTIAVNASLTAYAAANSARVVVADIYSVMVNSGSANKDALANYQSDAVHPTNLGMAPQWAVVSAAMTSWVDATVKPFPSNSSDAATKLGLTLVKNYGPWASTSAAAGGTGMSGQVATGFFPFRNVGTGAGVCSVVDRLNASLGYWQQVVYTPGVSTADVVSIYCDYNAAIASAGLVVGDLVYFGVEVQASGLNAANCLGIRPRIEFYDGIATMGTYESVPIQHTDAVSQVFWSAKPIKVLAGSVGQTLGVEFSFAASATPVALTVKAGRFFTRKA